MCSSDLSGVGWAGLRPSLSGGQARLELRVPHHRMTRRTKAQAPPFECLCRSCPSRGKSPPLSTVRGSSCAQRCPWASRGNIYTHASRSLPRTASGCSTASPVAVIGPLSWRRFRRVCAEPRGVVETTSGGFHQKHAGHTNREFAKGGLAKGGFSLQLKNVDSDVTLMR